MTKNSNERQGADKKAKICVIGNSYCGAVKKAYQSMEVDTGPYEFYFFSSGGTNFDAIQIADGMIVNSLYSDGGSTNIFDYDAIVLYADFPVPRQFSEAAKKRSVEQYSIAVQAAILKGWIEGMNIYKLICGLRQSNLINIALISRNYLKDEHMGSEQDFTNGVDLIRQLISPASYILTPNAIFSSEKYPREELYRGSLNAMGVAANLTTNPHHDNHHLNLEGGKVMLSSIVEHFLSSWVEVGDKRVG